MAKKKSPKTDGLGPREIQQIRNAVRQVWQRCHARALVVKRCLLPNGFSKCEKCGAVVAKIKVDHIVRVGAVDDGFIARMFVPSTKLQGWCDKCHNKKTAQERKEQKQAELSADWFKK
jgi:hypothetical protein